MDYSGFHLVFDIQQILKNTLVDVSITMIMNMSFKNIKKLVFSAGM
jgi:hypothetical protein